VEFEHNSDGVSVTREVDEVLELVDVDLYILFALEVAIRFEPHERCGGLILWAEHQHKFLRKVPAKHIFPDRNSCRKMRSAKLAACPPLK
jgi:hypothetical protein